MNSRRALVPLCMAAVFGLSIACADDGEPEQEDDSLDAGEERPDAAGEEQPVCTREGLRALVDDYFDALAAHDATLLPLASEVKFTENAEQIELGEGLWRKAGPVRFKRSALDTERCGMHTQAVLDEDGVPVIFSVRLQLVDDQIAEIETYIAREGDYFFFSSEGLVESDNAGVSEVQWEALVPEDQRNTRDELNKIADLYFDSFGPEGYVAPMFRDCYRWENGVQTTFGGDCSFGLPPEGQATTGNITNRRYPIADVEAGIAIGYVFFGGALDIHMFKIIDSEIRLIQAVVTASGHTSSGWEEQVEGAVDVDIDTDSYADTMCATINYQGLWNLGSYGTCQANASDCSAGTKDDMAAAAASPMMSSLGGTAEMIQGDCLSGLTCCINENGCDALNTTFGGLEGILGNLLGGNTVIPLPEFACQQEPCTGAEDLAPMGCPGGGFCCASGS